MLKSKIIWKMAWLNLRKQKLQSFLSILASAIGVLLIIMSVVFYQSFDHSGQRWLQKHFATIEWELVPEQAGTWLDEKLAYQIMERRGNEYDDLGYLPVAGGLGSVMKLDAQLQIQTATDHILMLGVNFQQLSSFDTVKQRSWPMHLSEDQVIVSEPVAAQLQLVEGDIIAFGIREEAGEDHAIFKVAKIIAEEGISGYRGSEQAGGTILMHPASARQLFDIPEQHYSSILVSRTSLDKEQHGYPYRFANVTIIDQMKQALHTLHQWKNAYGITLLLTSGMAALAALLLIRQIMKLLVNLRQESFAVLRALGVGRNQIKWIFFTEAMLLNVWSTLIGCILGCFAGYGIVKLFQVQISTTLLQYGSMGIPIIPHIDWLTILFCAGLFLMAFMMVSWLFGWNASRMPIIHSLRLGISGASEQKQGKLHRVIAFCLFAISLALVTMHMYSLVRLQQGADIELFKAMGIGVTGVGARIFLYWFAGSLGSLYLFFAMIPVLEKVLNKLAHGLGISRIAQMLAFRYPLHKKSRSLTVAMLFSIVFTILIAMLTFMMPLLQHNQKHAYTKTFHGYTAYVPYKHEQDKARIAAFIQAHPSLQAQMEHHVPVEPYRLNIAGLVGPNDTNRLGSISTGTTYSVVAPTAEYLTHANLSLYSRAPEYASDAEAWEAVMAEEGTVILHEKFAYAADELPSHYSRSGLPLNPIEPGETLEVAIHPSTNHHILMDSSRTFDTVEEALAEMQRSISELERSHESLVQSMTVKIAGYVRMDAGNDFYNLIFASPKFTERFREYARKWPNDRAIGFYLIDVSHLEIAAVKSLQEQFLIAGIPIQVPVLQSMAENTMDRHTVLIYSTFMFICVCIGLAGLAIIQYRSVHERQRDLAIYRCVGVSKRSIYQMFMMEGSWIGWAGLINGTLFGSTGGYTLFLFLSRDQRPWAEPMSFAYPFGWVAVLLGSMMLIAWLQTLLPARLGSQRSPLEALRKVD